MVMKKILLSAAMLMVTVVLSACSSNQTSGDLHEQIIEYAEQVAEPGSFEKGDIYIDSILYGSYSQGGQAEMLALCKFQNNPHVAGLDRTLAVIFSCQTKEMVASKCFHADEVMIRSLPTESGENRILFLGSSTSQGLTTQQIGLYCIQNGEWTEILMDEVHLREEDMCYMVNDDRLGILPGGNGEAPAGEPLIYSWDTKSGQFSRGESQES